MAQTSNCSWSWRKLLQIRNLARQFVVMQDGVEVWKKSSPKFKIAEVWKEIRPKKERVSWYKLLWSSLNVPKHAVVVWMAILSRLPTKDRLITWGMEVDYVFFVKVQMRSETIFSLNVIIQGKFGQ